MQEARFEDRCTRRRCGWRDAGVPRASLKMATLSVMPACLTSGRSRLAKACQRAALSLSGRFSRRREAGASSSLEEVEGAADAVERRRSTR